MPDRADALIRLNLRDDSGIATCDFGAGGKVPPSSMALDPVGLLHQFSVDSAPATLRSAQAGDAAVRCRVGAVM